MNKWKIGLVLAALLALSGCAQRKPPPSCGCDTPPAWRVYKRSAW